MRPVNTLSLVLPGLLVPARWLADAGWRARLEGFASVRRLSRAVAVTGPQAAAAALSPTLPKPAVGGSGSVAPRAARHDDPGGRRVDERLRSLPHERWLAGRFGLEGPAAWCGAAGPADGAADAAWRIDPVRLQAGLDHVVMVDSGTGAGSGLRDCASAVVLASFAALVDAVAPLLRDEGIALRPHGARRWYLDDRSGLNMSPATPLAALGRSIDGLLPRGVDARRWRRILTEIEMTWHDHPANEALRAAGAAPVTSLWLAGPVPRAARASEAVLAGTDASLAGVALLSGARHVQADDAPSLATIVEAAGDGDALVLHTRLLAVRSSGDAIGWLEAWPAADALLGRALDLLDAGSVSTVDIVATGWQGMRHRRLRRPGFLGGLFGRRITGAPDWLADDEEDRS